MDMFTLAQAAVNLFAVALSKLSPHASASFSRLASYSLRGSKPDRFRRLTRQYGIVAAIFTFTRPEAEDIVDGIERVLQGRDQDAIEFKQSVTSTLNMVASASAFIAQVAITALSLDKIENVHWTAAAFFVTSLMSGLLAVFSVFVVLSKLNNIIGAQQLREWLGLPPEPPAGDADDNTRGTGHAPDSGALPLSRNPSLAAALVISSPTGLLSLSLLGLIIGTGIYLGCIYTDSLIPSWGVGGSRAILVFYCLATSIGLFQSSYPAFVKDFEVALFEQAFRTANEKGKETAQEAENVQTDIEAGLKNVSKRGYESGDTATSRPELDKMLQAYLQTQEESQRLGREILLALSQLEFGSK